MRALAAAAVLVLLAGCATTGDPSAAAERDRLEGFNRGVWGVNRGIDTVVLKPVSTAYRTVAPKPARRGLSRVLSNLGEPFSAINNLLQGKPDRAWRNLQRFVINTTAGVGGLADHATGLGVSPAEEDFGQTLASWGVGDGGYLVLPLLGPSTLRDGVGTGVGFVADPFQIGLEEANVSNNAQLGITGLTIVSTRAELTESGADAFLESSLDPYAAARSAYFQRRRQAILNQEDEGAAAPVPGSDPAADPALEEALKEIEAEQGEGAAPAAEPDISLPPADAPAPPPTAPPSPD